MGTMETKFNMIHRFIEESKRIEGISGPMTEAEYNEYNRFLALEELTLGEVESCVQVFQPDARLREHIGMNAQVGNHVPIPGGPSVVYRTIELIEDINDGVISVFNAHRKFEKIHPFTDGNGRGGRMIWAWMMNGNHPLGFLHTWYYQSLEHARN